MKRFINPDKSTWKLLTKRSSASYDSIEPLAKSIFKKVEKEGDQKIIIYSFGKKRGSIKIEENFYDNLTLQIQVKMNFLKKGQFKINYFDKGKIKIKSFLNTKEEIIYKSKPVEVFEFTEQREDKRYFKFLIRNDSDKETIKVFQGGRGFNVDWELD